jgi:hypothetical protein
VLLRGLTMSEHDEQAALIRWAKVQTPRLPALRLLFAVPNGGQRHAATAARLKAEGVRPGVPDVCLPVPSGPYHGLFIELKRPKRPGKPAGRPTDEQLWWLGELQAVGYCCGLAYGWDEARALIEAYLQGEAA